MGLAQGNLFPAASLSIEICSGLSTGGTHMKFTYDLLEWLSLIVIAISLALAGSLFGGL
jgi:hypothetical protein